MQEVRSIPAWGDTDRNGKKQLQIHPWEIPWTKEPNSHVVAEKLDTTVTKTMTTKFCHVAK